MKIDRRFLAGVTALAIVGACGGVEEDGADNEFFARLEAESGKAGFSENAQRGKAGAAGALSVQRAAIDCEQARARVAQLAESTRGAIRYAGNNRVRIDEATWNGLPAYGRTALLQMMAVVASCGRGRAEDVILTVHPVESDRILWRGRFTDA